MYFLYYTFIVLKLSTFLIAHVLLQVVSYTRERKVNSRIAFFFGWKCCNNILRKLMYQTRRLDIKTAMKRNVRKVFGGWNLLSFLPPFFLIPPKKYKFYFQTESSPLFRAWHLWKSIEALSVQSQLP